MANKEVDYYIQPKPGIKIHVFEESVLKTSTGEEILARKCKVDGNVFWLHKDVSNPCFEVVK